MVLRQVTKFRDTDKRRKLRWRQIFRYLLEKNRRVALACSTQQITNLLVQAIRLFFTAFFIFNFHCTFLAMKWQRSNGHLPYLRPSSPIASAWVKPPTRGNGRPLSVTATATKISFARGASFKRTSIPSKWLRT